MAGQFPPGETVQLKSGGPVMTVARTWVDDEGVEWTACVWFDDKKVRQEATFPSATLET